MIVFSEFFGILQYAYDEKGVLGFCLFDKIMLTKMGFEIL